MYSQMFISYIQLPYSFHFSNLFSLWSLQDEKDKKIQELTAELRVKKRLSAAYREHLLGIMKDVESHSEHLSSKVQAIRENLRSLDAERQELLTRERP